VSHTFFDRAIQRTLRRPARQDGVCPDANQLAEYIESRCARAERLRIEDHLAGCDACQEVLALSLKLSEPDGIREPALHPEVSERRILFRLTFPISALAAVLIIVIGVFLLRTVWHHPVVIQTANVIPPNRPSPETPTLVAETNPAQPEAKGAGSADSPRKAKAATVPPQKLERMEWKAATAEPPASTPAPAQAPKEEPVLAAESREINRELQAQNASQNIAHLQRVDNAQQFRAAAAPTGVVGGVAGGIQAKSDRAVSNEPVASFLQLDRQVRQELVQRVASGRTFYQWRGYWIDGSCLENPGAPVIWLSRQDPEFADLAPVFQELKEEPAAVFRLNRILVIR
jgi:hypothetical protein